MKKVLASVFLKAFVLLGVCSSFMLKPAAERDVLDNSDAAAVAADSAAVADSRAVAGCVLTDQEKRILRERLFAAVQAGDVLEVKRLITQGAPVNDWYLYGVTPLICALRLGYVDIVRLLVDAGADANMVDGFGKTPLMRICASGGAMNTEAAQLASNKIEICMILLEKLPALEVKSDGGNTVLAQVIDAMSLIARELVNFPLGEGFDRAAEYIFNLTMNIVDMLLGAGAVIDTQNDKGETPLMMSLSKNLREKRFYAMAKMLIIAGANLGIKDNEGRTAFDRLETAEELDMFAQAIAERDLTRAAKREAVMPCVQGASPLVDLVLAYEGRYPVRAVQQAVATEEETSYAKVLEVEEKENGDTQ